MKRIRTWATFAVLCAGLSFALAGHRRWHALAVGVALSVMWELGYADRKREQWCPATCGEFKCSLPRGHATNPAVHMTSMVHVCQRPSGIPVAWNDVGPLIKNPSGPWSIKKPSRIDDPDEPSGAKFRATSPGRYGEIKFVDGEPVIPPGVCCMKINGTGYDKSKDCMFTDCPVHGIRYAGQPGGAS